jgi:hypothetical protein
MKKATTTMKKRKSGSKEGKEGDRRESVQITNKNGLQPTLTVDGRPILLIKVVGTKGFEPSTPRC